APPTGSYPVMIALKGSFCVPHMAPIASVYWADPMVYVPGPEASSAVSVMPWLTAVPAAQPWIVTPCGAPTGPPANMWPVGPVVPVPLQPALRSLAAPLSSMTSMNAPPLQTIRLMPVDVDAFVLTDEVGPGPVVAAPPAPPALPVLP